MMSRALFLAFLALCLVACSSAGQGGQPLLDGPELARQGTLAAQQSQAYQQAIFDATRTAEARIQATQQAQAGTAAAIQGTANAVTATAENAIAEATRHALILAAANDAASATAQAIRSAAEANATASAVAALADLDRQMMNGEATRQALVLRQEEAAAERAETWAEFVRFGRWVLLALAVLLGLVLWKAYKLRRSPVVVMANDREHVLYDSHYYRPLQIGRAEPAGLLASAATTTAQPVPLPALTAGHVLIVGETGSGKSTALKAVAKTRRNVVVLDPHARPGAWGGARVVGGGHDFDAIGRALDVVRSIMRTRYQERNQGQSDFEPMTIMTDEMPVIVDALGRDVYTVFKQVVREGRKVQVFMIVSSQSKRVKTLGIDGEGDLLNNMDVLVLGKTAVAEYGDVVRGMERPAVLHTIDGVQPVVIPYTPETPRLHDFNPMPRTNGLPIEVVSTRPAIEPPEQDDINELREREDQRIRELLAEGMSMRQVQFQIFGYDGGEAYKRVVAIKQEMEGAGVS